MTSNGFVAGHLVLWLMLTTERDDRRFWHVSPEGPCWKGETGVSLLGITVVFGWQGRENGEVAP